MNDFFLHCSLYESQKRAGRIVMLPAGTFCTHLQLLSALRAAIPSGPPKTGVFGIRHGPRDYEIIPGTRNFKIFIKIRINDLKMSSEANNDKELYQAVNSLHDLDGNHDELGDNHLMTSVETPLRNDAFDLNDEEKIEKIESHFRAIMEVLGLDLDDESLRGTPERVAKMYVTEIFGGLNPANKPRARKFSNNYRYGDMILEKNIQVLSFCEHHFLPFIGKAHVAYISSGKVIGLSKINRIVDYFSRRPQVQERLTLQIADELEQALRTEDVAVFIESRHFCVSMRGIRDAASTTVTTEFRGAFRSEEQMRKFNDYIKTETKI